MHKALTIETNRRTSASRVCIPFPIRIRFPSCMSLRLVPFCQRLRTPPNAFDTPLCTCEDNAVSRRKALEQKPRRAFSNAVRIKDSMFTRTWSSETTATHNARNNGDCTRISSAHPCTLVAPTIHRECGVLYQMIQTYFL